MRTKEHIQDNIKLLESSLEGTKFELRVARKIQDRIDSECKGPDENIESDIISSALGCYIGELDEQIHDTQKVIDRERKKLQEVNKK